MAEIILEPTAQSKVIPLSIRLNDTDTSLVSQLVTNRQFSTADTDAWFSFTLEGLAATTGTFDLTLINLQDKSVFNHTDKVFNTNPFYYKLDSGTDELTNEIRHAGKWVGQLVVTLANGDSATRKFIFGIEGHILDGTVVQTIFLEDYNALIASIESAKDELTQYNIDYASLIGTVTEQEAARLEAEELRVIADALRETKEGIRQATFEANEVIRDGVVDSAIEGEMISQTVVTKLTEKEATYAPRLLSAEQQLADIASLLNSSLADGVQDCLASFNAAKTAAGVGGVVKFPQNPAGNAVYYFSANPNMLGVLIDSDDGVILSFPSTTLVTTFKAWKFLKPIKIHLRDRNNTSEIFANFETDFIGSILATGDVSKKIGIINPLVADATAFTKLRRYTNSDGVKAGTSVLTSSNQVDWDLSTVPNNVIDYVEQPALVGREYLASLVPLTAMSAGAGRGGIVVTYEGGYVYLSIDRLANYYFAVKNTGVAWAETAASALPTKAYAIARDANSVLSVLVTSQTTVEFYINGWRIKKATLSGNVESVGFGYYSSGLSGMAQCLDFITSESNEKQLGDIIKLFISGDSLTFGEAVGMDWPSMLKSILVGQYGIPSVTINNQAVSGQKAATQLGVLNAADLSSYTYTLVLIGTNDIIQQTALATFRQNILDMINSIKADGSIPIIGIPPMYIDQALTGTGFYAANYAKGAAYRSAIYRIAAEQGVTVADTLADIGKIGIDNTQLRDNLHLQSKTNAFVAKSFARAILSKEISKTTSLPTVVRTGNNTVYWLATMPSSGYYTKADIVYNTNPTVIGTAGSQYTVIGWRRITSGTSNVLNTDWVEMRAVTGS